MDSELGRECACKEEEKRRKAFGVQQRQLRGRDLIIRDSLHQHLQYRSWNQLHSVGVYFKGLMAKASLTDDAAPCRSCINHDKSKEKRLISYSTLAHRQPMFQHCYLPSYETFCPPSSRM